ncbi:MAG TPA: transport-associated protein [Lentisphaeria bacterium]|nr:MAG: hypothetical protein A2X48_18630 [Lentisphaerae bacterium GWF2_49_21]HBC88414.1 transport-associated protein [Lentisphaeria bacterium]
MKQRTICHLVSAAVMAAMFVTSVPLFASEADDGMIESLFKKTYVYKNVLKNDAVKCEAKDGVVTLTGTVSDETYKVLAQETVECLPGVSRVDNKLAIKDGVSPESGDTLIRRKINLALLVHRSVNLSKTVVEVKDGVVTLKGEASNLAQKELTAEYAKDIDGVKDVKNEMTLAVIAEPAERTEGQKIDDASVAAQVKTALSTHRSTSAVRTKIEVRDGDVTLTGIARNEAEKSLVTKLVTDIQGVTSVRNKMTIEEAKTK